ncbi:hypothetical protein FSP39_011509 [Pinctada imbricata]|uniref:Uncharacterized protein n=1 Tax=Pinctada imbricata TaxID=66713 RepID=A0AA88XIT0_PINIB|nr:hypothetical protein FSP39_011509 [Pinctada imbricata]
MLTFIKPRRKYKRIIFLIQYTWEKKSCIYTEKFYSWLVYYSGAAQREPALKLAAVAVDCIGIKVVLPPSVQDCKLLLIITHLCCIEVRMILETYSHDKVVEKAEVLCSCYQILEHVIGHMTSAPSLLLDDKQILQLHTAMLGAFNAVVGFLHESAESSPLDTSSAKMPEPVVIATVRVLGAWLAEETSALKKEIYQILPYLILICKIQILLSQVSTHTRERNKERKVQFDISEELDSCSLDSKCENIPSENLSDSTHSCTSETESRNVNSSVGNNDIDKKLHEATDHNTDMKNSHQGKEVGDRLTNSESNSHDGTNSVPSSHGNTNCVSSSHGNTNSVSSSHGNTNSVPSSHGNANFVSSNGLQTNSLSSNVDVIRLLLPGLCHLSAEDEPRKILLENQAHELLNQYFKSAVSLVLESPHDTITKSSVELLCGIFLNITVQEPILVSQDLSFHNITGIIMEACPVIGN